MDLPRVDISKLPHPSVVNSALLFVPGFFFELVVATANPPYLKDFLNALPSATGPGLYVRILVGIFLAFLIGGIADAWVRTIRGCMSYAYLRIRRERERAFHRMMTQKLSSQPTLKPTWRMNLVNRMMGRRNAERQTQDAGMRVWAAAASQLLKAKYRIEPPRGLEAREEWAVWYGLLGWPGNVELRGSSLHRTFHAIGWCGLAAIHFAPPLRSRLFVAGCAFLILHGIYQEWTLVLRFMHPTISVGTHILSVLREFPAGKEPNDLENEEK